MKITTPGACATRALAGRWCAGLSTGLLLLTAGADLRGADDVVVSTFDTVDQASSWQRWWGSAGQVYEWDGTVDAANDPNSGSLKCSITFDYAAYGGDNQFAVIGSMPTTDGTQYTNLVLDLRWNSSSPTRPSADYGYLEYGFRNSDYSQNWLGGQTITVVDNWIHLEIPIDPNRAKLESVTGVVLKIWSGNAASAQTGTAIFWVDNVRLIARPVTTVVPPTMSVEKADPGLRIFASNAGSQYQRQGVRTMNPIYTWVGSQTPVTYALTIGEYPQPTYNGFQTHMFLVPGSGIPNWETSPDWNEPHTLFFSIVNNADGSGYAQLMYKTNLANGNSMYWAAGNLGGIGAPSTRGTWSVTFLSDTDIRLSNPAGATADLTLPAEAAALFSGSVYAYFGAQPNQLTSIGQSMTLKRVQISGLTSPIDDQFSGAGLDLSTWQIIAEDVVGVVPVPADAIFWMNWTLPDRDFSVEVSLNLDLGWQGLPLQASQIATLRRSIITPSVLPANGEGIWLFRMIKP